MFEETISSRKALNKRQLGQLLDELKDGDILIAAEISRLCGSVEKVRAVQGWQLLKITGLWGIFLLLMK